MTRRKYVVVFAKDIAEGNAYARELGLSRGQFRTPGSAAAVRGLQYADVHVLPSFEKRRDKHAMMAAIRHARGVEVLYQADEEIGDEPTVDELGGLAPEDEWLRPHLEVEPEPVSTPDPPPKTVKRAPRKHKSVDPVIEIEPAALTERF